MGDHHQEGASRQRRDDLLEQLLDLAPDRRPAFLDEQCGAEPSLRAELERLLAVAAHVHVDFLEAPPHLPSPIDLPTGAVLGRYVIERRIGAGGMSSVYVARDPVVRRRVAIKVLAAPAHDETWREQFFAELRMLGQVNHDHVVRVYDFGETGERLYLVTELLEGEDLGHAIAAGRTGDAARKLDIARQIAVALRDVHEAGIVHRDLKPGNVFLERSGRVKLIDFGISRTRDVGGLTKTVVLRGTPEYMAPERLKGDAATVLQDVYSYGILLFELFSGRRPFTGDTPRVLHQVLHEPLPLAALDGLAPGDIVGLIGAATAKDPKQRIRGFEPIVAILDGKVSSASSPAPTRQASPVVPAEQFLGGHLPVGLALAVAYGSMVALALLVEVAYQWPAFVDWALPASLTAGACSTVVLVSICEWMRRRAVAEPGNSLTIAILLMFTWSAVVALALAWRLPNEPIVLATFQTMTGRVGFVKSLLEALALPVLSLVPLHVVFSLQAQLKAGRAKTVLRLLTHPGARTALPGVMMLRPPVAGAVFAVVTIWWMAANGHLFESLLPGPYFGLFLELAIARVSAGLLTLLAVLLWYLWTLTDLRREALEAASATR
jgi:tRNA A-37 threonylcarbamoyl transferase component Bud32